jgi:hypothetical protein
MSGITTPIVDSSNAANPPKSRKRKLLDEAQVKERDNLLFLEKLRDEKNLLCKKRETDSKAPVKHRMTKENRAEIKQKIEEVTNKLNEHINPDDAQGAYVVMAHRRIVFGIPWEEQVFPVFTHPEESEEVVKFFRFETNKPYFDALIANLSESVLKDLGELFQRNSAVNPETLSIERIVSTIPRRNWRPDSTGFTGNDDWSHAEKLARMLCAIFSGKVKISRDARFRAHVAKMMIAAIAPKSMNPSPEPNSQEALAMVKYLWKHVGVMKLCSNSFDTKINSKGELIDCDGGKVDHVIVYRVGFSSKFKPRLDVVSHVEDRRRVNFLEETTKGWLYEMTKQLLLGADEGYEAHIPQIVANYVEKNSTSDTFDFINEFRNNQKRVGEIDGVSGKIPLFDYSNYGNPCVKTVDASKEESFNILFNDSTENTAFLDELLNNLSPADVKFWAASRPTPIPEKEALKPFKTALQGVVAGVLKAKFNSDVAGLAIVRRSVAAAAAAQATATQAAASRAAQATGSQAAPADADVSAINAKLDMILKIIQPYKALSVLAPKLIPKLMELVGEDEVMEAGDDDVGADEDDIGEEEDDAVL